MIYILLLITISTTLSYIILKCIYRIIFKSKKRISKFLVFLGSIGLIIFYYTPYSFYLEPSYWKFRSICKINELPNNEEKYNKILSYFDTDLENMDWEELNGRIWKMSNTNGNYKKGVFEYATFSHDKALNYRIDILADFLSNQSPINKYNTSQMSIHATWHTRRYFPAGNEGSGFYWDEATLECDKIAKYNMIPKGESHDKQKDN